MSSPPADRLGPMTLRDDYVPGLQAGTYRVAAQHSVTPEKQPLHYYRDRSFIVTGPRFHLGADDVHACFPPPSAAGDYKSILPHLVLRKRALPWERELIPREDDGERLLTPWLALLVLTHEDLTASGAGTGTVSVKDLQIGETEPATDKTVETVDSNGDKSSKQFKVLLPSPLDPEADDPGAKLQVLDLPAGLFVNLCPRVGAEADDLRLLAHVRQVETSRKVPLKMAADGEFSVMLAGRFPQDGSNAVHLVSLEGWLDLLQGHRAHGADDLVRLVSLYSWSFVNSEAGSHTFGELMQELNVGAFGLDAPANKPAQDPVVRAFAQGNVPVDYQPRHSDAGFAWYRGPFSPVRVDSLSGTAAPFDHADAALVVDPETGILDVSYACAWQLGRLLALASPAFGRDLLLLRQEYAKYSWLAGAVEQLIKDKQKAVEDERHDEHADPEEPKPIQPKHYADAAAAIYLVEWLARLVLLYPVPFHYLVADDRLLPTESLRFFHVDGNWMEALVEGALSIGVHCSLDREAHATQRSEICAAVSRMVRQYRKWLREYHHWEKRHEWQDDTTVQPSTDFLSEPKSGFLLRSRLVHGWPGVEIEVYGTPPAGGAEKRLEPLRWDDLGAGTLLCLVEGTITRVVFREPRENLRFGVDDEDAVVLRYLGGKKPDGDTSTLANPETWSFAETLDGGELLIAQAGGTQAGVKFDDRKQHPEVAHLDEQPKERKLYGVERNLMRQKPAPGVLDAVALAKILAGIDKPPEMPSENYPEYSPAAFALQLTRSPEDQTIEWRLVTDG